MTEISTEELAQYVQKIADARDTSDFQRKFLTQVAARLRALAEDAERLNFVGKGYVVVDATAGDTVVVEEHDIGSQDVDVYMYEAPTLRQALDKARHD